MSEDEKYQAERDKARLKVLVPHASDDEIIAFNLGSAFGRKYERKRAVVLVEVMEEIRNWALDTTYTAFAATCEKALRLYREGE